MIEKTCLTSAMISFLWSMSSPSFSLVPDGVLGLPPSKLKRSSTASFPFTSALQVRARAEGFVQR